MPGLFTFSAEMVDYKNALTPRCGVRARRGCQARHGVCECAAIAVRPEQELNKTTEHLVGICAFTSATAQRLLCPKYVTPPLLWQITSAVLPCAAPIGGSRGRYGPPTKFDVAPVWGDDRSGSGTSTRNGTDRAGQRYSRNANDAAPTDAGATSFTTRPRFVRRSCCGRVRFGNAGCSSSRPSQGTGRRGACCSS